jgi:hypothetical protein
MKWRRATRQWCFSTNWLGKWLIPIPQEWASRYPKISSIAIEIINCMISRFNEMLSGSR